MTRTRSGGMIPANFSKRLRSMLKADSIRMFSSPLIYIMLAAAFIMPVLILVMTAGFGGDASQGDAVDMFTNTWQIIASPSEAGSMAMDMTAMCNINLVYFMAGVFLCLFVADDFRSGYVKNLFTVRAKKADYVASKTLLGFAAGALMLIAFFIGAVVGGAIAGLPFELGSAGTGGLVMCMLSKIFLMAVFIAIFMPMCCIAKQRTWLSIKLSLFAGMLLFMMIPMMTPLDAGVMNALLCLAGGAIFSAGLGAVSDIILRKEDLV